MRVINMDGRRNISGEQVRLLRTKKRMSQAALAAKVQTQGVILEQDVISRIESGERMVQDYELWAMAEVLGVTTDELTGRRTFPATVSGKRALFSVCGKRI